MSENIFRKWSLVQLPFLFLFIFSMPCSIAGMEIATFFLTVLGLVQYLFSIKFVHSRTPKIMDNRVLYSMLFYWLLIVISGLIQGNEYRSLMDYFIEGRFILFIFFGHMAFTMQSQKVKKILIWFLFFQSILVACFAIYQSQTEIILRNWNLVVGPSGNPYRVRGFFSNTMTFSYVMGMVLMFFFGKLVSYKKATLYFWATAGGISIIGASLILTYTRGLWIAVFLSMLICVFLVNSRRIYAMAMISFSIILCAAMIVPEIFSRILSIFSNSNSSREIRFQIWEIAFEFFKENPWFGVGLRNFQKLLPVWYEANDTVIKFIGHCHNNYLEVLVGLGIFGLLAFVFMHINLIKVFFCLFKNTAFEKFEKKGLYLGVLGALLIYNFSGATESSVLDYEVNYTLAFFVMLGLAYSNSGLTSSKDESVEI